MDGSDQCSPVDETKNRLHDIDTVKDQTLFWALFGSLPHYFFPIIFPLAAFEYILEQVTSKPVLLSSLGS